MKFVTYSELQNYGIKYSRVHIGRLAKDKKFPLPVAIGAARVGWIEAELLAWQDERVAERDRRHAA